MTLQSKREKIRKLEELQGLKYAQVIFDMMQKKKPRHFFIFNEFFKNHRSQALIAKDIKTSRANVHEIIHYIIRYIIKTNGRLLIKEQVEEKFLKSDYAQSRVSDLDLNSRCHEFFKKHNIVYVKDLVAYEKSYLLKQKNLGVVSVAMIERELHARGLYLGLEGRDESNSQ